jgi:hypothetical protein
MLNYAQLLAPWLMWAGSALLLGLFVRGIRLRKSMANWPKVRGVICELIVRSSRDRDSHRPNFMVEYSAGGSMHRVQCESPTRLGFGDAKHATAVLKKFKVGQRVSLFVDPRDHTRAYLYPPEPSALVLLSCGAVFLFLLGVGMANGASP